MGGIGGKVSRALFLYVACTTIALAQAAEPVDQLKACARTADREARIACYEALGRQVLDAEAKAETAEPAAEPEPPAPATTVATAAVAGTPALKEDLGGEQFRKEPDPADGVNRGLITSCKKGPSDRWYFYFDNGQVWKQTNSGRLHLSDCERVATISKDWFGYRMEIEGHKGKIRIARVR